MSGNFAVPVATLLLSALLAIGCGKSEQASGNPATPEAFVEQMEAAMASGDGEAIARLVAPPGDAFVRERYKVAREVDAAHGELEKALDKAYGPPPAGRTAMLGSPLAEMVIAKTSTAVDAKKPKVKMTIKSQKTRADGALVLEIDETFQSGRDLVQQVRIAIVHTKDGWRLDQPRAFLPQGVDRFETEKQAVGILRQGTKEVAAGLFKSRSEAEDVIAVELVSLIAAELMNSQEWANVPEFAADAKRLRLIPDDADGLPPPQPATVELAPGTRPGLMRLSILESRNEVAVDDVAKKLRERFGAAAAGPPTAVHVSIAPGLPADDLLKVFHALVDLRSEIPQGIGLVMQAPKELEKVAPQLTGRLRFLSLVKNNPFASMWPPVEKLGLENTEPKLDLDKTEQNIGASISPLVREIDPSAGVPGPLAPASAPVALPPASTGDINLRGPGALSPAPKSTKP